MTRSDAEKTFSEAVQAYKDGHFKEAVALHEKIIAAGFSSTAVYYDLGNSYLKDQRLGKALVQYLRAQSLAPRDADLLANLAFVRNLVEGGQALVPSQGVARFLWRQRMSVEELQWVALFFLMAAGIFCLVGLYRSMRTSRVLQGTVVLSMLCLYFTAACVVKMAMTASMAVVIKADEAKFEPSKEATTYFKVPEGQEVWFLRRSDGWAKIERPDGKSGWVVIDSLEKVVP